jgi:hypothetical protein
MLRDLPAHRLEPLLSTQDRRVRRAAYRAAIAAGHLGLDRLTTAAVRDHSDQRLRASSRADLAAWLDREAATAYRGPSRHRAAELDHLIEQARSILGEHRTRLLRFHAGLDTAG